MFIENSQGVCQSFEADNYSKKFKPNDKRSKLNGFAS